MFVTIRNAFARCMAGLALAASAGLLLGATGVKATSGEIRNPAADHEASAGQAPQLFNEIPGVRQFSGRMIVRPVQPDAWSTRGLSAGEADEMTERAVAAISKHTVLNYVWQTDEYIIEVPAGSDENRVSQTLMATDAIQYAEPDWIVSIVGCPNDSRFYDQWHHQSNIMQSCDGWDIWYGDPATSVGVCDTGIRTTHQDFQQHRLEGYNAVDQLWESEGGAIDDINGHGTAMTGAAAANGNNSVGVSGVGWNLSYRMLRVTNDSSGNASLSALQHAARTAIETGSRVASVSYSGIESNSNLTTATYIKSIGGLLVWAAGNDGGNRDLSFRDSDDIICVAATTSSDTLASFSGRGRMIDVCAPGVNFLSTSRNGDASYANTGGTSGATALTSGLCTLIFSADPSLTPDQVEDILKNSVEDLGDAGPDDFFGYGRLNVYNAMLYVDPNDCDRNGVSDDVDFANCDGSAWCSDCNNNGVLDVCDIDRNSSSDYNENNIPDECETDCNSNGYPDDFELAEGITPDCNSNGIPDDCDVAAQTSDDINANLIPDECEPDCNSNGLPDSWDITLGDSADCNANFTPDECDIALATSEDCNENGVPDECDVSTSYLLDSGALSPFGAAVQQSCTFPAPTASDTEVVMTLKAHGDLEGEDNLVIVLLNGVSYGSVFDEFGRACADPYDVEHITLSAAAFNNLIAGGDLTVDLFSANAVDFAACDPSWISVEFSYRTNGSANDANGNGVPDECETNPCPWDTTTDGTVGLGDLNALLSNWGPCPAPCPYDFAPEGGDESVGLGDLNALLSNWGPCP
jgi:hypothetical protein